jgi:hypothetical protein
MTRGKNVVVSDELRNRMIKPRSLERGVWKENIDRRPACRVKPTSSMLIEKYPCQQECRGTRGRFSRIKRQRSPVKCRRDCTPGQLWSDAISGPGADRRWSGGRYTERRMHSKGEVSRRSHAIVLCGGGGAQDEQQT